MSSFGVVPIGDVLAMLAQRAPGVTYHATEHYYCINYNGKSFPSLPPGEHGRKRKTLRSEVKIGDVRKMLRHLGVSFDCAKQEIPRLGQ